MESKVPFSRRTNLYSDSGITMMVLRASPERLGLQFGLITLLSHFDPRLVCMAGYLDERRETYWDVYVLHFKTNSPTIINSVKDHVLEHSSSARFRKIKFFKMELSEPDEANEYLSNVVITNRPDCDHFSCQFAEDPSVFREALKILRDGHFTMDSLTQISKPIPGFSKHGMHEMTVRAIKPPHCGTYDETIAGLLRFLEQQGIECEPILNPPVDYLRVRIERDLGVFHDINHVLGLVKHLGYSLELDDVM